MKCFGSLKYLPHNKPVALNRAIVSVPVKTFAGGDGVVSIAVIEKRLHVPKQS
jgi:hypothetical protein